jgi:5S rRNA maturation endonuclease (ribonuclease M5)
MYSGDDVDKAEKKEHNRRILELKPELKKAETAPSKKKPLGKVVARYIYKNADGLPIYQVHRYEPKDFRPFLLIDNKPIAGLAGVTRLPYRLPELIKSKTVWVVEGEKDADRLHLAGIVATTRAGGAKAWETELTQWFENKDVILCGDNDKAGERFMQLVGTALLPVAASVKRVKVPSPHKDISDLLEGKGGDAARSEVAGLLKEAVDLVPEPEKKPPTFYYAGKGGYAMESKGHYIPLPVEGNVKAHLRQYGITDRDALESMLCKIREENYVAHIGPLAGYPPGLYKSEDSREQFLVTVGPEIIPGVEGDFSFIYRIIAELLEDEEHPDQMDAFVAWLAQARRNLVTRAKRPIPALVLVGPREGGKSILIDCIIQNVLGGRGANAYAALSGGTNFNRDTIGSELLKVDDAIADKKHMARTRFAQGLKSYLFAGTVRVEGKGKDAITLRPIQAVAIAVNEEPKHLQVLPEMDDSLMDKISLLRCRKANVDGMTREEIAGKIKEELPALIFALETFEIPENLRNNRTGAKAWQHPHVMRLLVQISPEEQFRELLMQHVKEGSILLGSEYGASQIEEMLKGQYSSTRSAASGILCWSGACGSYLGLLRDQGLGIESRILTGQTLWKISNLERR